MKLPPDIDKILDDIYDSDGYSYDDDIYLLTEAECAELIDKLDDAS